MNLSVAVNNSMWGGVYPTNEIFSAGSLIELLATPATYFRFKEWKGDVSGTQNPITILMETDKSVLAVFEEILTSEHPTPYWWLASHGYTNDFETAVNSVGLNGLLLWQSYIAGLNPNDPTSQLQLSGNFSNDGNEYILNPKTFNSQTLCLKKLESLESAAWARTWRVA